MAFGPGSHDCSMFWRVLPLTSTMVYIFIFFSAGAGVHVPCNIRAVYPYLSIWGAGTNTIPFLYFPRRSARV